MWLRRMPAPGAWSTLPAQDHRGRTATSPAAASARLQTPWWTELVQRGWAVGGQGEGEGAGRPARAEEPGPGEEKVLWEKGWSEGLSQPEAGGLPGAGSCAPQPLGLLASVSHGLKPSLP